MVDFYRMLQAWRRHIINVITVHSPLLRHHLGPLSYFVKLPLGPLAEVYGELGTSPGGCQWIQVQEGWVGLCKFGVGLG
jgi:hypothetical protein